MHFHHLHFYVRDAAFWRDWFVRQLGFQSLSVGHSQTQANPSQPSQTRIELDSPYGEQPEGHQASAVLVQGNIEIWLSEPADSPLVAAYLRCHPPGLADVALATDRFDQVLTRAIAQGTQLTQPIQQLETGKRTCQLQGWADLRHTLVEVEAIEAPVNDAQTWLQDIDHVVINVPKGELTGVSDWYQQVFGLQLGQYFEIQTARSGLRSQVLRDQVSDLQLPINEPSSANSQIQEFLHHNRGAGVQHVALRTNNAISAIAHFRQQGLALIHVPETYYEQLTDRANCPAEALGQELSDLRRQQLLIDWAKGGQHGWLMQTFTQPIFSEPTFFFEIIQRGHYIENKKVKLAQGFGEGNFQALFEAIERAQIERGSLLS